jgi:hypothetical protein
MPNSIKYSASAQTLALKKGNLWIGTGDVGKGPSSTTGYYNGVTPSAGGYTIYSYNAAQTGNLSYFSAANDAALIAETNRISGASYTTAAQCLNYFATQTDRMVCNTDYPAIVTNGLVLNLDAGFTPSYPTTGTTWYDVSSNGYNGALTNGPTFSSANNGSVFLDGVDDYVNIGNQANLQMGTGDFTVCLWIKMNNPPISSLNILIWSKNAPAAAAGYGIGFFYGGGNSNKLLWGTANGSTAVEILSQNAFPELLGAWGHIVMVRQNGSTNNGCFYINNQYQSIASSATMINVNTNTDMVIGNTSDRYGSYWTKGNYAIAQIYNRALSASEVSQNYNAQKSRFGL